MQYCITMFFFSKYFFYKILINYSILIVDRIFLVYGFPKRVNNYKFYIMKLPNSLPPNNPKSKLC